MWKLVATGLWLVWGTALADESAGRAKISGEWRIQSADHDSGERWILESKDNAIHVSQMQNGQKLSEFDCNTMGRECDVEDSGHHAKVSFYFNGAKLVQLETRGSEVVKRRFSVEGEGGVLEIEVIPVVPGGKPTVLLFKRAQESPVHK